VSDFPGFEKFFHELHGYAPFLWQSRLAEIVSASEWPRNIGVPTGLGKTSTIEIALWNLAADAAANGSDRTAPTRLWYVVNRRLLVDSAYNHAVNLQHQLSTTTTGAIGAVGESLRAMQAINWSTGPLHVARLRGGAERGFRAPDPSCAAVMLTTVPMYGSRLLFRGYGSSAGLRPIDAALAGTDSLVLLDEAHLAQPLRKLLASRSELKGPETRALPGHRDEPFLVSLTASGETNPDFDIDPIEESEANPAAARRLRAAKPTMLASTKKTHMARALAEAAVEMATGLLTDARPPAIVIFANTARQVPDVRKALEALLTKSSIESSKVRTLTGRMRPYDATNMVGELTNGELSVASQEPISGRDAPLFVVATQTLEVGADFDFDGLVTETAGVRSIVQRFGRLNRLGLRDWAQARIVHAEDRKTWPVYGEEPSAVWERLLAAIPLEQEPQVVGLGPLAVRQLLGEPADNPPRSPELLPNHVREWAKTSSPMSGSTAPIEPFVIGEDEDNYSVTVLWREMLPKLGVSGPQPIYPLIHPDESIEVPIAEFRDFAAERQLHVLRPERSELVEVTVQQVRPGEIIVLPSSAGGYTAATGWDAESTESVPDISPELRFEFVLSGSSLRRAIATGLVQVSQEVREFACAAADRAQFDWSGPVWVPESAPKGSPLEDVGAFDFSSLGLSVRRRRQGPVTVLLDRPGKSVIKAVVESDDELSTGVDLSQSRSMLDTHLRLVGERAQAIGQAIGFGEREQQALALAGRVHDAGKSDPRFQHLLGAEPGQLLAKSVEAGGPNAGIWPTGARHEAVSGMLFGAWLQELTEPPDLDLELVWHLVISHHGFGRPLVRTVRQGSLVTTSYKIEGAEVSVDADLTVRDWQQPERFERLNNRYGHWGLALLEAVLRQADHAESSVASNEVVTPREVQ